MARSILVVMVAWTALSIGTGAFGQDVSTSATGKYRQLAPGVMKSPPQGQRIDETFSRHDVPELLVVDPKWDWAADVDFRRPIWSLNFQFKPVRMIWIDMPQPSGLMQRKQIWYMVYSVTNDRKTIVPVQDQDLPYATSNNAKTVRIVQEERAVQFVPEFLLEAHDRLKADEGFMKVYPGRVIPLADREIQRREDPQRKLLNTAEICGEIPFGESRWGVVTWEDIDPRIVRFSVYVKGLTNAYRWEDDPAAIQPGGPVGAGRRFLVKTLKINFWRPGDEFSADESEIRLGPPGGVDYEWVYR